VTGVVVPDGGTVTAGFDLVPDTSGGIYMEEMTWLLRADPNEVMPTTSINALGAPDDSSFSLGRYGDVCLSAGRSRAVPNVSGHDITIFDSDSVADGYWFYAGNNWAGPWTSLGHANGTASFDIGSAELDSARYLRIVCDSTGSSSDPRAGLDLDAVAYAASSPSVTGPSPLVPRPSLAVFPNPASRVLHIAAPRDCRRLEIIDIAGRTVECYAFEREMSAQSRHTIDVAGTGLAPGVYLARFETAAGTSQHKFVVARP
jgi:hypothetical protein